MDDSPIVAHLGRVMQCPLDALEKLAPGAAIEGVEKDSHGNWKAVTLRWRSNCCSLHEQSYGDQAFHEHLALLYDRIANILGPSPGIRERDLLQRIARTRRSVVVRAMDASQAPHPISVATSLARAAHGLLESGAGVAGADGGWLIDPTERPVWKGGIALSPSSIERRKRTEQWLRGRGRTPAKGIRPCIADDEALLIDEHDVVARACGCWITALRGEGIEQERAVRWVDKNSLWERLTLQETAFLRDVAPGARECTYFTWNYESALLLLWSVQLVGELPDASEVADAASLTRRILDQPLVDLIDAAEGRPLAQILDVYDLHHCMLAGRYAGIRRDVLERRLRALQWLLVDGYAKWDDITVHQNSR